VDGMGAAAQQRGGGLAAARLAAEVGLSFGHLTPTVPQVRYPTKFVRGPGFVQAAESRNAKNSALQRSAASIAGQWPEPSKSSISTRPPASR
jgi:hypothetical protein